MRVIIFSESRSRSFSKRRKPRERVINNDSSMFAHLRQDRLTPPPLPSSRARQSIYFRYFSGPRRSPVIPSKNKQHDDCYACRWYHPPDFTQMGIAREEHRPMDKNLRALSSMKILYFFLLFYFIRNLT